MPDSPSNRPTITLAHTVERTRFGSFRFIVLLGLLDAFGPLGIDMYLPGFPAIGRALSASPGAMQWTLSAFLAGLAVGQLICGPISDRVGRRRPLLVGSALFAVACATCAFARSFEAFLLARFVMGLAGATGMVVARAIVRDSFEESESSRVYSMLMLVIGVAPVLAPTMGGWLISLGGWGLIFWALGAFALTCGLAVAIDLPETLPADRRVSDPIGSVFGRYAAIAVDRMFLAQAAPVGLALAIILAYVASAPSLFLETFALSPQAFSRIFAVNAIGLIGSAQLNRWLVRRYPTRAILRVALLANAAISLSLPILAWTGLGGVVGFTIAIFLCLSTLGIVLPNATAAAMAPFAEQAGTASALLGASQFALGAFAGWVVGVFHDGTPLPMALTIGACGAISLAITLAADRRPGHVPATAAP